MSNRDWILEVNGRVIRIPMSPHVLKSVEEGNFASRDQKDRVGEYVPEVNVIDFKSS